jgi:Fe-S oxidoreductase
MASEPSVPRNGKAPFRHPIDWRSPDFYDAGALEKEMDRVFEICHNCRRCVSLCQSFPTLFDLIDNSPTMEPDSVSRADYPKVVEQCYLCDLCFMTKCPYVPPHEWNVDFPHLMLRAKAVNFRENGATLRDRVLTSTDLVGRIAGIPVLVDVVNHLNRSPKVRAALERGLGISKDAPLPEFHSETARQRLAQRAAIPVPPRAGERTRGKVALFATCYGNRNAPDLLDDLVAVYAHNDIEMRLVPEEHCCGMPKLELGDLEAVARAKAANVPPLLKMVDDGYDIVAPVPSCVLMFKQELPLLFPEDEDVQRIREHIFDPMEYLSQRHREGLLKTDFKNSLGKVVHHAACHQRVQNIGQRAREVLSLVPGCEIQVVERCSGHDGTYTVKAEFHEAACRIGRPVAQQVAAAEPQHWGSDCPLAAEQIRELLGAGAAAPESPWTLLCHAYGLKEGEHGKAAS